MPSCRCWHIHNQDHALGWTSMETTIQLRGYSVNATESQHQGLLLQDWFLWKDCSGTEKWICICNLFWNTKEHDIAWCSNQWWSIILRTSASPKTHQQFLWEPSYFHEGSDKNMNMWQCWVVHLKWFADTMFSETVEIAMLDYQTKLLHNIRQNIHEMNTYQVMEWAWLHVIRNHCIVKLVVNRLTGGKFDLHFLQLSTLPLAYCSTMICVYCLGWFEALFLQALALDLK